MFRCVNGINGLYPVLLIYFANRLQELRKEFMTGRKVISIYFILYMGFASWRVFYNVYLEENDFSGTQIGIINALIQASLFVVVPIWGYIADKRGIRPTLRIAVFASAVLLLGLGYVINFWWLIAYIFLLTLFHHPLGPLIDALAVQFSQSDKKYNYGNMRLWGSFGWAVASIIGGYLFMKMSLKIVFPVTSFLFLVTLIFLRTPRKSTTILYRPHFEKIRFKELRSNSALLIFLAILFLYGIASSPVNAYMNLYFSELGADHSMIGIAYTVQSLSELPFFIIGNRLLKRFGAKLVIIIAMFAMIIRLLAYAFIPTIPVALGICALQGISLSFFLVGAVDYLQSQLPKSRHATAQSLLWGLYFGLGHTIGNLIIGILKDMQGMVGVMGIFTAFTCFIFLLTSFDFTWQLRKRKG